MKEIYRLPLNMRKVLTKFLIPPDLLSLAICGGFITHASNKSRNI